MQIFHRWFRTSNSAKFGGGCILTDVFSVLNGKELGSVLFLEEESCDCSWTVSNIHGWSKSGDQSTVSSSERRKQRKQWKMLL